mmetsp:Transcript_11193/g.69094  ORF Transcript_11193/g.69094 Transcript_11193/m.69094 type:complete len:81 (-) Transcript_11193:3258-3500(-)
MHPKNVVCNLYMSTGWEGSDGKSQENSRIERKGNVSCIKSIYLLVPSLQHACSIRRKRSHFHVQNDAHDNKGQYNHRARS